METKVIFSAEKASGENFIGDITYDRLVVNIGGGFDMGSGVFVVPTSGTYRLSFSGQTGFKKYEYTNVKVKKNGTLIFVVWDSNDAEKADAKNLSYTWLMNLTQGDRVNLSSANHLFADYESHLTFTGELIHI